jgi:hypothetical protein
MAWVAGDSAAIAGREDRAGRPDAEVEGGMPALGEDKAFVGAHFGSMCLGYW